jgi:hypothetical protein
MRPNPRSTAATARRPGPTRVGTATRTARRTTGSVVSPVSPPSGSATAARWCAAPSRTPIRSQPPPTLLTHSLYVLYVLSLIHTHSLTHSLSHTLSHTLSLSSLSLWRLAPDAGTDEAADVHAALRSGPSTTTTSSRTTRRPSGPSSSPTRSPRPRSTRGTPPAPRGRPRNKRRGVCPGGTAIHNSATHNPSHAITTQCTVYFTDYFTDYFI